MEWQKDVLMTFEALAYKALVAIVSNPTKASL
jgi:hypothetical protein